jgi:2-methylcitrate dehydratase PrpD
MDAIETLLDYAMQVRDVPHPPRVTALAKNFLFDTLSLTLVGAAAPGCAAVAGLYAAWGGAPEATVLRSGQRLPAPAAALVNAMFTHAFDFDDSHESGDVHGFAVVLPAVMALAERGGAVSGRDFLAAAVTGVEIAYRMGEAIRHYRGWHPTATCGVIGATIAGGMIAGLDRAALHNAAGIAYSLASGNWQSILDGSLTKRMQPAFAARAAVEAVTLASAGITGAKGVLEGKFGFYPLYEAGEYDREALLRRPGEHFELERASIKPFPCCRFCHAAAEAALVLAIEHDLAAAQVERVVISVPPDVKDLVGVVYSPGDTPEVSAQFSIPFCVATAVIRRRLGLREFQRDAALDPDIRALATRVEVVAVPEPNRFGPQEIAIALKSGRTVGKVVSVMKGHPTNPLTRADLKDKARQSFAFVGIPPELSDRLEACIDGLDASRDAMQDIVAVAQAVQ